LLVSHVGVYRPDLLCTTSINQSSQAADAANISHATAYRYFPNTQSLWTMWRLAEPALSTSADLPDDVGDRVELVIRRITHMQFADEALWREALRASPDRWLAQQDLDAAEQVPVRGTNRLKSLTIAVAPLQNRMDAAALERLTQALMFLCGVEALVVARDALDLDEVAAAVIMCWSPRSLIRTAVEQSADVN
jgi:AcrR family transcriptional regulator